MEIIYTPQAIEDLKYWKRTGNKPIQKKIEELIIAIKKVHSRVLENQSL